MILLALFSLLPITIALVISFTDMDMAGLADYSNISFIGFDNYKEVLQDPSFQNRFSTPCSTSSSAFRS
ncbi:hypothetical protein HMSSN036_65750 [Paenibacillus macerans]|nr:hypothetical protein HMSSN036_65750 [Paenibacillus macerans]